jgi:hypothetical protein
MWGSVLVPRAGLEPARAFAQQILSLARLPIPPSRRRATEYAIADTASTGGVVVNDTNDAPDDLVYF